MDFAYHNADLMYTKEEMTDMGEKTHILIGFDASSMGRSLMLGTVYW